MKTARFSLIAVLLTVFNINSLALAATSDKATNTSTASAAIQSTVTQTKTIKQQTSLPPLSDAEKARIEDIVHQYLLKKPEVILEVMQILQRRQYEEAEQTIKNTQKNASQYINGLFKQANDPVGGNPNGPIQIVEFFDYQCPHCIDMIPTLDAIIKTNPDVKIIYKDFPVRGPMSELAARAALAANKQGKYQAFSHALLTANKPLDENVIYQIAQNVGLNVDTLKKDMNDQAVNKQLSDNMKLAQDLKLFGTPAFFIGKSIAARPTIVNGTVSGADVNPPQSNTTMTNISYVPGQMNTTQLQNAINQAKK